MHERDDVGIVDAGIRLMSERDHLPDDNAVCPMRQCLQSVLSLVNSPDIALGREFGVDKAFGWHPTHWTYAFAGWHVVDRHINIARHAKVACWTFVVS